MADDQGTPGGDEGLRALEKLAAAPPRTGGAIPRAGIAAILIALAVGLLALWATRDRGASQALGLRPTPETEVLELLNRRTAELEGFVSESKALAAVLSRKGQLGSEVCATRAELESYRDAALAYRDAVKRNRMAIESAAADVEAARTTAGVEAAALQREGGVLYRMLLSPDFLAVSAEEEQGVTELTALADLLLDNWGEWSWPRTSAGPEFNGDDAELVRARFISGTKRMVDAFQRQAVAQAALQKQIAQWREVGAGSPQ